MSKAAVEDERTNSDTNEREFLINWGEFQAWISESSLGADEQALVTAYDRKRKKKSAKKRTPKSKRKRATLTKGKRRQTTNAPTSPGIDTPAKRPKLEQANLDDEFRTPLSAAQNHLAGSARLGRDTISVKNRRGSMQELTVDSTTGALLLVTPSPPSKPVPLVKPESVGKGPGTPAVGKDGENSRLNISVSDVADGVTRDVVADSTTGFVVAVTPTPPKHHPAISFSASSTRGYGSAALTPGLSVPDSDNSELKIPDNGSFSHSEHRSFGSGHPPDPSSDMTDPNSYPTLLSANALALSGPPPLESGARQSGPPPLERPISAKGGFKRPSRARTKRSRRESIPVSDMETNAKTPPRFAVKLEPKSPLAAHFMRFPSDNGTDVKPDVKPDIKPIIKREMNRECRTPMVLRSMGKADKYAPLFSQESMSVNTVVRRKRRRDAARQRRQSNPVKAAAAAAGAVDLSSEIASPARKKQKRGRKKGGTKRKAAAARKKTASTSKKRRRTVAATLANKSGEEQSDVGDYDESSLAAPGIDNESSVTGNADNQSTSDEEIPSHPAKRKKSNIIKSDRDNTPNVSFGAGERGETNDISKENGDGIRSLSSAHLRDDDGEEQMCAPITPYTGRVPETPISVSSIASSLPYTPVMGSRWLHENISVPLAPPAYVDLTLSDDEDKDVQITRASDFHAPRREPPRAAQADSDSPNEVVDEADESVRGSRAEGEPLEPVRQGSSAVMDIRARLPPLVVRVNRDLQGEFEQEQERGSSLESKGDIEIRTEGELLENEMSSREDHPACRSSSSSHNETLLDIDVGYFEDEFKGPRCASHDQYQEFLSLGDIMSKSSSRLVCAVTISLLSMVTVNLIALNGARATWLRSFGSKPAQLTFSSTEFMGILLSAQFVSHLLFRNWIKDVLPNGAYAIIADDLAHLVFVASVALSVVLSGESIVHLETLSSERRTLLTAIVFGYNLRALVSTLCARRSPQRCFRDASRVGFCVVSLLRPFVTQSYPSNVLGGVHTATFKQQTSYLPRDSQIHKAMVLGIFVQTCVIIWRFAFATLWPRVHTMFHKKQRTRRSWCAYEAHPVVSAMLSTVAACFINSTPNSLQTVTQNVATAAASANSLLVATVFGCVLLCAFVLCALTSCCLRAHKGGRMSSGIIVAILGTVLFTIVACGVAAALEGEKILKFVRSIPRSSSIHHAFSRLHYTFSSGCRSLVFFVLSDGLVSGLKP